MFPARQHFETDDLAGRKIDLRLEIRNELAMVEAKADSLLDLPVSNQGPLHARVKPNRASNPAAARAIHRDVGAAKNVRNAYVGRGCRGDASEGADLDDPVVEEQRPRNNAQHGVRELLGAIQLGLGE